MVGSSGGVTGYQIAAEDYPYLRMRAAVQRP